MPHLVREFCLRIVRGREDQIPIGVVMISGNALVFEQYNIRAKKSTHAHTMQNPSRNP